MDYFSKFLKASNQPQIKAPVDHAQEFHKSWDIIKNILLHPDERQITKGIKSTDVPTHLQSLVDALVWESTRTEEGGTGACLEYLLKNDVLGTLVRLSETDRPSGIQAEVLRAVQNMVVLMDEQFLVHSAVHRAVLRLLRNCVGDDLQEQLDGKKIMGAARSSVRGQPSEYEEDLVNLLCILCSRIRTYRELLMIFFHDKHWYHSEPLFSVDEGDEDEDEDDEDNLDNKSEISANIHSPSPPLSLHSPAHPPTSSLSKKTEYEFLLFNYLLRFVHREGQIGDFARAGLLFLMDVAMSPGEPHRAERGDQPPEALPPDPINDAALALAEYILDGDFSEVLGAGLGAVYSLLPSKLAFHTISEAIPGHAMVIGGLGPETIKEKNEQEATKEKSRALGVEDALNPDFKARLDHFLKLLEFLQDVLRRNVNHDSLDASALVGTAIGQSILEAVRQIFLENVLYPSILECSDTDGSAVAVMSYIEIMIRTLHTGQLADLLVKFLLSEDNDEVRLKQRPSAVLTLLSETQSHQVKPPAATDKKNKLRRRKSSAMVLLEMEAPESRKPSEYFTSMGRFTLRDLLLTNLKSVSQPTATSALQLLQSMLIQHPQLTTDQLLIVIPDPSATNFPHPTLISLPSPSLLAVSTNSDDVEPFTYPGVEQDVSSTTEEASQFLQPDTTYSTHEREMGLYLALVSRVDPSHNDDAFSTGYDHYLHDALFSIQNQPAYQINNEFAADADNRRHLKHRLNVNDPILSLILESLRKFFSNTPEFNIALTGVLAILAIHPDRSLAGWLTFATNDTPPSDGLTDDDGANFRADDGDDRSIDFRIDKMLANDTNFLPASSMDDKSRPIIHAIFHGLVTQLERYRHAVDRFDQFLLERRQGLLFSENMTDALTFALDLTDEAMPIVGLTAEHPPQPKPKPKASASSFVSFLTPKKNRAAKAPPPSEPSTPSRDMRSKSVASPFGQHYQHTGSIVVEPFLAPVPTSSLWAPARSVADWNADEEDVFTSSGWGDRIGDPQPGSRYHNDEKKLNKLSHVTLSQLLDNVVILEESIKELVAIIHARRSLGIDSIRYL
ncbi:Retinoic acid induced 16-like protein-domain-containing protein [Collybia nuda]|uniref:Retinoic acid induced 16-like protein-domain-containing protein n=1 Tax=Collybia nuda TaxID=64659 RepID=A0A9P5Y9L0_9AGAR|nr:Retinoic acid induced 16-like protein-domain-containing protein [Collybia nuda]